MKGPLQLLTAVLLATLCHSVSADPFTPKHIPSDSGPFYVLQIDTGDGLDEFVAVALIGYCGGDPVNRIDPMGLDWGDDEDPNGWTLENMANSRWWLMRGGRDVIDVVGTTLEGTGRNLTYCKNQICQGSSDIGNGMWNEIKGIAIDGKNMVAYFVAPNSVKPNDFQPNSGTGALTFLNSDSGTKFPGKVVGIAKDQVINLKDATVDLVTGKPDGLRNFTREGMGTFFMFEGMRAPLAGARSYVVNSAEALRSSLVLTTEITETAGASPATWPKHPSIVIPPSQVTVGQLINGANRNSMIHITTASATELATGLDAGSTFVKLNDVANMTVKEFQKRVVAPTAAGWGQHVKGFVVIDDQSARLLAPHYERGLANIQEYQSSVPVPVKQYIPIPKDIPINNPSLPNYWLIEDQNGR